MRPRSRLLAGLFVLLLLAGGLFLYCRSAAPSSYAPPPLELLAPLRTPAEHDAVRAIHGEPYILELSRGQGALLYYGGAHTTDPQHPQFDEVQTAWEGFRPSVALCEGRAGYLIRWPLTGLDGMSDPELVHALARRDFVTLYTLEPAYADEVAGLLEEFAPEHVALYFTLRVYRGEAGGGVDEGLAEHLLAKRTDVEGLRGALPDLAAMDALWRRDFDDQPDWRASDSLTFTGVLAEIDDASRRVRGRHMTRTLIDLVRRGERVFAFVGSGHVIRQEPALRAALGE